MLWVREVGDRDVAVILRHLGRFDKKIHLIEIFVYPLAVKGKVDFPQIGFEKGTTERGVSKVSKSC